MIAVLDRRASPTECNDRLTPAMICVVHDRHFSDGIAILRNFPDLPSCKAFIRNLGFTYCRIAPQLHVMEYEVIADVEYPSHSIEREHDNLSYSEEGLAAYIAATGRIPEHFSGKPRNRKEEEARRCALAERIEVEKKYAYRKQIEAWRAAADQEILGEYFLGESL